MVNTIDIAMAIILVVSLAVVIQNLFVLRKIQKFNSEMIVVMKKRKQHQKRMVEELDLLNQQLIIEKESDEQ